MKTKELLFLFLLLSLSSCAKKQHEPLPTQGLLWKISGNGLKTPSYLFGTYHGRGGAQIIDSIKGFDSIFFSTNQLVCEIEIDFSPFFNQDNNKKKVQTKDPFKPWPVADSTYANLLTVREKGLLDSMLNSDKFLTYIKKMNLRPITLLDYLKFSNSELSNKANVKMPKTSKPDQDSSRYIMLDLYLQKVAKKRNINIVGLETREEIQQIDKSLLNEIPQISYKVEVAVMMNYVKFNAEIDSLKKYNDTQQLSAYLKQDIYSIYNANNIDKNSRSKSKQILSNIQNENILQKRDSLMIEVRNNKWLKQIPDLIAEKSCFIAVGNAHLGGQKGLINQLRNLGYTVESLYENKK